MFDHPYNEIMQGEHIKSCNETINKLAENSI